MTAERDRCPAPPHLPPGDSWGSRARFRLRTIVDFQVASVHRHIAPWLREAIGNVLDVGCGAQPYRHLLPPHCRYQGLDWTGAGEHFAYHAPDTAYYSGDIFPFGDASFDAVFHTEVLEHVYAPETFLAECLRVLRPGGRMLFTVPFQARYHYIPHDYWRFTPASLQRLLEATGFVQIEVTPRGTDITVAAYKLIGVVRRLLSTGGIVGRLSGVVLLPIAAVLLPVGWLSLRGTLGSSDDCLGYTVAACRPEAP